MIKEQIKYSEDTLRKYKNQLASMKNGLVSIEADYTLFNKIDMNKVFEMFPETIQVLQRSSQYIDDRKKYLEIKYKKTIEAIEAKEKTISDLEEKILSLKEEAKNSPDGEFRFNVFFTNKDHPKDKEVYVKIKREVDYDGSKFYFLFYTKESKKHNHLNYVDFGGISNYSEVRYARYYNRNSKLKIQDYSKNIPNDIVNKKACLKQMRRILFREYFNDTTNSSGKIVLDPKSYDYEELQGLINLS